MAAEIDYRIGRLAEHLVGPALEIAGEDAGEDPPACRLLDGVKRGSRRDPRSILIERSAKILMQRMGSEERLALEPPRGACFGVSAGEVP